MLQTNLERPRTDYHFIRTPWFILFVIGCFALMGQRLTVVGPVESADNGADLKGGTQPLVRQIHYASPAQVIATNGMSGQVFADLTAETPDGGHLNWESLSLDLPVVLVFVKQGCPCNVEFEQFFQRVERLYRGSVRFATVIDGDADAARAYAAQLAVPYPVLPDPERSLIRGFQAENGGYFVLLGSDGVIDGFWPGCSADSLRDLGRRIARHAAVEERSLDTESMPGPLLTGCPFER